MKKEINKLSNKTTKLKKSITFFYTDHIEKSSWKNLYNEAIKRNYKTKFTNNLNYKAEIGFYCHDQAINNNAKLSFIFLHGIDQNRNLWPNPWELVNWNFYDYAVLPGQNWADMWAKASYEPFSRPKKGVYKLGWSKADNLLSRNFKAKRKVILKKINSKKKTILYAPSFETDNKQLDIIKLAKNLEVNLIIKHWPTKEDKNFKDVYNNIKKLNKVAKKELKNVLILPSKLDIFLPLSVTDLLITDESSVMYEAMIFDIPTVIPKDWKMRINNTNKPRSIIPSSYAFKVCKKTKLLSNVKYILNNLKSIKKKMKNNKIYHFSNIGKSSSKILDLIDGILYRNDFQIDKQIKPHHKVNFFSKFNIIKKFIKKLIIFFKKFFFDLYKLLV